MLTQPSCFSAARLGHPPTPVNLGNGLEVGGYLDMCSISRAGKAKFARIDGDGEDQHRHRPKHISAGEKRRY